MPYVPEHAHGPEHPLLQQHGEQYEASVDETVEEPVELASALDQGKPTPEGKHPEEVAPERVVFLCVPVYHVRPRQHDKPENERNYLVALRLIVVAAVDE